MGDLDDALFRVAAEIIERLCDVSPRRSGAELPAGPPEAVAAVRYDGHRSGVLRLGFHRGAGADLARRMSGEGAPSQDALNELANIVCGNVLPFVYGPSAVFRLDATASHPPSASARPRASSILAYGDGWVELDMTEDVVGA